MYTEIHSWIFIHYSAIKIHLNVFQKMNKLKLVRGRILRSYRMMLNFCGIKLVNPETGQVEKGDNWEDRFDQLYK